MSRNKPPPRRHGDAAEARRPGARQPRPEPRRRESGAGGVWLYGTHAVLAAAANPDRHLLRLQATREAERQHGPRLAACGRALPPVETVERADLDRLLPPGAVHQGLAALVAPLEPLAIDDVVRLCADRERAVVVMLDQVTDPHNVGAVLRSAAAFGAVAVIVQDRHAPEEAGTLAKAASGALERVPLARAVNLSRALDELKEAGFLCVGLAADAPATLAETAPGGGKVALVLGSEGEGIRRLVRERCDMLVRLPMTGAVESLNVSNAAAVALYELVRA